MANNEIHIPGDVPNGSINRNICLGFDFYKNFNSMEHLGKIIAIVGLGWAGKTYWLHLFSKKQKKEILDTLHQKMKFQKKKFCFSLYQIGRLHT